MLAHEVKPAPGSRRKRKRVGRGTGSGHGTYSGRGSKGHKARTGGNTPPRFEGGQNPIVRMSPQKRGFTNIFKQEYEIVNVGQLSVFAKDSQVTPQEMRAAGLVKAARLPVKVLADGELNTALVVVAQKFSAAARQKIEAAGGKVVEEVAFAPARQRR